MKTRFLPHGLFLFLVGLLILSQISSVKAQANIPLTQDCENGRVVIRIDVPTFDSLTDKPFDYIQITRGRKRTIGPISFTQPVDLPKIISNQQVVDRYLDPKADYIYTIKAIKESPLFNLSWLPSINLQNNEYRIAEIPVRTISCDIKQEEVQPPSSTTRTNQEQSQSENATSNNNSTIIGGRSAVKIEKTNKETKQERVIPPDGTFSNLSATLDKDKAVFDFNFSDPNQRFFKIHLSKTKEFKDGVYWNFIDLTTGNHLVNSNPDETWNDYTCNKDYWWRVEAADKNGNILGKRSHIQGPVKVECPTTVEITKKTNTNTEIRFPTINKKGERYEMTKDELGSRGLFVDPCTAPEDADSPINLIVKKVYVDPATSEKSESYIFNGKTGNCVIKNIAPDDIGDLDKAFYIKVTANYLENERFKSSSDTKNIDIFGTAQSSRSTTTGARQQGVSEPKIVSLKSSPENPTPGERVLITATVNQPANDPTFVVLFPNGNTSAPFPMDASICPAESDECQYQTHTIAQGESKFRFCMQEGICEEIIVNTDTDTTGGGTVVGAQPKRTSENVIGVYLQLPDSEAPLPLDGSEIEFPVTDEPMVVQVKIIYDQPDENGEYEQYKYFTIRYQPPTTEEERGQEVVTEEQQREEKCGEFQAIRNECTSCGYARVIGQNNCGQTQVIEENVEDSGCKTIQYCVGQEEKKETIEYQTEACDDVYYPEEGNGGTGCTHKYSKSRYPDCQYTFDVNAPRYACGLE